jgi:hypothetical protein
LNSNGTLLAEREDAEGRNVMKKVMMSVGLILGLLALGALSLQVGVAQENEYGALLKVLPNSKHQLADGIRQATKSTEVPISAKFELDDNGKLSLSIYTAEKGLASDAESNVLKELSGSPESAQWSPEIEVFKDAEHLKRSAEQQTLMSLSPFSLLDTIARAEKEQRGRVISITPAVRDRKAEFVVLVADRDKVNELVYDIMTGRP